MWLETIRAEEGGRASPAAGHWVSRTLRPRIICLANEDVILIRMQTEIIQHLGSIFSLILISNIPPGHSFKEYLIWLRTVLTLVAWSPKVVNIRLINKMKWVHILVTCIKYRINHHFCSSWMFYLNTLLQNSVFISIYLIIFFPKDTYFSCQQSPPLHLSANHMLAAICLLANG